MSEVRHVPHITTLFHIPMHHMISQDIRRSTDPFHANIKKKKHPDITISLTWLQMAKVAGSFD